MANRETLKALWQQRIQSWRDSGLSQKGWCEQHDVRQPQFWYWRKKLEVPAGTLGKGRPSAGFVPVVLEQEPVEYVEPPASVKLSSLTVSLPNGLTVSGIEHNNLVLAGQLIGLLR